MDLAGRDFGFHARGSGLDDRADEILMVDSHLVENLQEAGIGLPGAGAVHAPDGVGDGLDHVEGKLGDILPVVRVHILHGFPHVEVAEGDVPRFIPQHQFGELAQQRTGGRAAHVVKRAEGQALHHHVHPDGDLHPMIRLEGVVDHALEPG